MNRLNDSKRIVFIVWLTLLTMGFAIGWGQRANGWERELESAADKIAASKDGMYISELQGVVTLRLNNYLDTN